MYPGLVTRSQGVAMLFVLPLLCLSALVALFYFGVSLAKTPHLPSHYNTFAASPKLRRIYAARSACRQ